VRFREGLAATIAAKALKPVSVFAESLAVDPAVMARHCGLAFHGQVRQNDSGFANPASGASPRLSLAGGSSHQRGKLNGSSTHRRHFPLPDVRVVDVYGIPLRVLERSDTRVRLLDSFKHSVNFRHRVAAVLDVEAGRAQHIPHFDGSKLSAGACRQDLPDALGHAVGRLHLLPKCIEASGRISHSVGLFQDHQRGVQAGELRFNIAALFIESLLPLLQRAHLSFNCLNRTRRFHV